MMNYLRPIYFLSIPLLLCSCFNNPTNISKSNKNDIIIHQLRVELEEIKHHLHSNSVQINIINNKIINNEDALLELTHNELIQHKNALEKSMEKLHSIEKSLTNLEKSDQLKTTSIQNFEEKLSTQEKSVAQNKNKIREMLKKNREIQEKQHNRRP